MSGCFGCSLPFHWHRGFVSVLVGVLVQSAVSAAILTSGDVAPVVPVDGMLGADLLTIGGTTNGTIDVNGGSDLVTAASTLGRDPLSQGTATVTENGSTWQVAGHLLVGNAGKGNLVVSQGASVGTQSAQVGGLATADGEIVVDGAGSTFATAVGVNYTTFWVNNGRFNVTAGGHATTGPAWLRSQVVGDGAALVDGPGSRWDADHIAIINAGTLRVRNGGVVQTASITSATDASYVVDENTHSLIDVDGPGSQLTAGIVLGNNSAFSQPYTAELVVRNGARFDGYLYLADDENATTNVLIEGPGTTWNYSTAWIGDGGRALVTLRNGAKASGGWVTIASGSAPPLSSQVVVEGPGTEWHIGLSAGDNPQGLLLGAYTSNGSLDVRDGAVVTSQRTQIGFVGDGVNRITARGSDTQFDHGWLDVGTYGHGLLEIVGGATVSGGFARLGIDYNGRGEVLVDGPGSTWTLDDLQLSYGSQNHAAVRVRSGGAVTVENLYLSGSNSTNLVEVDGAGSRFVVTGEMRQGYFTSGDSTVRLRHGAHVKIGSAYVGDSVSDTNVVEIRDAGSFLEVDDLLALGREASGPFTPTDSLTAFAGTSVHVGHTLRLGANARFTLLSASAVVGDLLEPANASTLLVAPNGLVTGLGVIDAHVVNAGAIAPGLSPGVLHVEGDFFQLAVGALHVELGGTSPDLYDRLAVGGITRLGGALVVTLLDSFVPEIGDEFTILDSVMPLSGEFQTFQLPSLPPDRTWNTTATNHSYKLSVIQVPEPHALLITLGFAAMPLRRRQLTNTRAV